MRVSALLLLYCVRSAVTFNIFEVIFGPKLKSQSHKFIGDTMAAENIIRSFGYHSETHQVLSEDGYILTMHRIPFSRKQSSKMNRPIALIHHGLLASSDNWLFRGPDKDLPYSLSDAGYDVWLCNSRGNFYSRQHTKLNPDGDADFWKFSFDEMGLYDLSATIDYVLNKTNQKSLHFIGHSMGATVSYILCSSRPEYNDKLRLIISLAPTAFPNHNLSPFLKIFVSTLPSVLKILSGQNIIEVFPRRDITKNVLKLLCQDNSPTQNLCVALMFLTVGIDYSQLNTTMFPSAFNYYPSGTSIYTIMHYYQMYSSGLLRPLDYQDERPSKFNQKTTYNISQITAPVALYYGDGDFLVTKEDNEFLARKLSNVAGLFRVPYKYFNHIDFMWSTDSKMILYNQVIKLMNKYR